MKSTGRAIALASVLVAFSAAPAGAMRALAAQAPPQTTKPATAAKVAKPLPQQGQDPADLSMTKQIEQAIAADKSLSADSRKVTVITAKGMVTLIGSVRTLAERQALENIALKQAGAGKVTDKVKVKPKKHAGVSAVS